MPIPSGSSFDANFYLSNNKDVKTAAEAAVKAGTAGSVADFAYDHWLNYGVREARNPNAVFNTTAYLANNADVQQAFNRPGADSLNPLTHYDLYGWSEKDGTGTDTTHKRSAATAGLFNADYYTAANPAAFGYGSPVTYFMAALRAAASATSTTSLSFAASAYAPTVAYLSFDFVYYLQKNNDVAKSVLGDKGTVPATNTAFTLIQKGKALYHWFNYGQMEGRIAHKTGSANDDKTSDFARITDSGVTAKYTDIRLGGTNPSSYTATTVNDTFGYITENTEGIGNERPSNPFTVTGWGGPDSAFVWESNDQPQGVKVTGIANLVFGGSTRKQTPLDTTGTDAVDGRTRTANGNFSMDVSSLADATVTKLALIHSGTYKIAGGKTITGGNNVGMSFYNIGENTSDLYIQGLTSGVSATHQYALFGYKAVPANNTVNLTVNNVAGADVNSTGVNISSKSAGDIKTIKLNLQGTTSSSLTLTAVDGDGTGTDLVEQRITKLVIGGGDKGTTLRLKDGGGTNTFEMLDASAFKGDELTYTATYGNHMATVLGGSKTLTYISGHASTDQYGQTFQFGTTDMGTNKAGTLAAVKTVGRIDVSNIPAGSNIVDSFNLSTKIFGFTDIQWKTIDEAKTYLFSPSGSLTDSATTANCTTADSAATGNDSYFYILGSAAFGIPNLNSDTPSVDLSFGKTEAGKGHAAIVVLKEATTNKMNIYFTEDNTKFDAGHATLIGSYAETGAWGTGAGKILDSSYFHIVA